MDDLTTFSARHLVTLLHQGEVSAVEVLEAHLERIQSVNPWIHALVVERFDSARREAERADHRRAGGEPLGPLHGLPVSIKEMFDVAELPTTAGIQRRQARAVSRDAELVRRWRAAGAIVLGKTNVPQLGILAESDNPVYGRTNNPWDWNRTPGGSSGGEAALIAAGGSPLGLGSDGGGSIRLPAHFCGICGFKPTGGRLPLLGHWLSTNWPADSAQPGPMARCVDDLVLGLQACAVPAGESAIAGEHPQRICAEPLTTLAGCRIGFYEELPFLPAAPAVRRAVRVAADALSGLGAELVPFRIDRLEEAWGIFRKLFYAEGLRDFRRQLRGSAVDPRVQRYLQFARIPRLLRPVLATVSDWRGQTRQAELLRVLDRPDLTSDQYCQLQMAMWGYRTHFSRSLNRQNLTAILAPISPIPAFPHGDFHANYAFVYTGIYNLLGLPAGALPITSVEADEVATGTPPRDDVDAALFRANRSSVGLPIGVQLVGRWWQDGQVLALMSLLEGQVAGRRGGNPSPLQRSEWNVPSAKR